MSQEVKCRVPTKQDLRVILTLARGLWETEKEQLRKEAASCGHTDEFGVRDTSPFYHEWITAREELARVDKDLTDCLNDIALDRLPDPEKNR